jgi:membrane protein DedA with SNARE-associated domain
MISLPIIETVVGFITTVMASGGLVALVLLMAVESFGIPPLPSEIILPFAGFLVATQVYSWPGAILAALLGAIIGSYFAYAVGRFGRRWLEAPRGVLSLDPKHLAMMDRWFARHGEGTVIVARMLPIVRSYISYPAGTAKMEPVRFGVYTFIGVIPFTFGLIYAGFVLGSNWTIIAGYFRIADYFAAGAIALLLVYVALRWRGIVAPGFPPRLQSRGDPAPGAGAASSAPDDRTPPP